MHDDALFAGVIILGASECYVSSWIFNQVVIHHDHRMITDHNRCPSSEIPEFTAIQGVKLNIRSHKRIFKGLRCSKRHTSIFSASSTQHFSGTMTRVECDQLSIAYRVKLFTILNILPNKAYRWHVGIACN